MPVWRFSKVRLSCVGSLIALAIITLMPACAVSPVANVGKSTLGSLLFLPATRASPGTGLFEEAQFRELLDDIRQQLEKCGFAVVSPLKNREFPFMESSYGATYRQEGTNLSSSIHATRSAIGIGFQRTSPRNEETGAAELNAMRKAMNAIVDRISAKHPAVGMESHYFGDQRAP